MIEAGAAWRPGDWTETPPDPAFERVAGLAIDALGVAGALIEVTIAGRPAVACQIGPYPPEEVQDLLDRIRPAARGGRALVVPDASRDGRLAAHPLVAGERGLRFVALVPVRGADGSAADGAAPAGLAVFGPGARWLAAAELRILEALAGMVQDTVGLRRAMRQANSELVRQRQIDEMLESSRNRYRSVVDSLAEVVFQVGFDGRWRFLNRAWTTLTGEDFRLALGRRAMRHVVPADRRPILELIDPLRQGTLESVTQEFRYRTSDNSVRWFELFAFVAQDEVDGMPVLTGRLTDVTQRRATEAALREAREEADRANRARAAFLATVSHEIRTPINGVIGMTGLLLDTALSAEQARYANTLRVSAEHLLQVINDILDYSKLDADKLEFELVAVRPQEIVDSVLAITAPRAGAKGIEMRTVLPPGLPRNLIGDPGRIRQVLVNLVGNAVKFTERGTVTIEVRTSGEDERRATLVVAVTDTGIGIPPEAMPALFREFSQVDSSVSRRFGGTGLGLAICKRLVEGMGGTIEVESRAGIGSTFRFRLPLARDPDAEHGVKVLDADDMPVDFARDGRVLVAEDNPTNQLIVSAMLEKAGLRADIVANGTEAVAAVRSVPYDMVLMDMHMPEMDGLEATRAIRRLPGAAGRVPIIGITANAFKEDHDRCRAAGMQGVVTKPFRWIDLTRAMAPHLEAAPSPAPEPQPAADPEFHGLLAGLPVASGTAHDKLILEVGDEAARAIADIFVQDSRGRLVRMAEHAARRELAQLGREAHALKGAVNMLGFERMTLLASLLEMAGQEGASAGEIDRLIGALRSEFAAVEQVCAARASQAA